MHQYKAKLLLFGEHTLLKGSPALAIPFSYSAQWKWDRSEDSRTVKSRKSLMAFYDFIRGSKEAAHYHLKTFANDLGDGLYLDSDIPEGYGLGSSGAVVAAFYDLYAKERIKPDELEESNLLRARFIALESYFHGSSSGIDPLVSYLDRPVVLEPDGRILVTELPDWETLSEHFFLIDTHIPRVTGPLVKWFLEASKDAAYAESLQRDMIPAIARAITALEDGSVDELTEAFRQISGWQFSGRMEPMIPDPIKSIWEEGLRTNDFYIKLCGAGGGGYFLGFAKNRAEFFDAHPELDLRSF